MGGILPLPFWPPLLSGESRTRGLGKAQQNETQGSPLRYEKNGGKNGNFQEFSGDLKDFEGK